MAYGDSPADDLLAVNAAIAAVLANQSYRIGDRLFKKADLKELRQMKKDIVGDSNRDNNRRPGASRANMSRYFG